MYVYAYVHETFLELVTPVLTLYASYYSLTRYYLS